MLPLATSCHVFVFETYLMSTSKKACCINQKLKRKNCELAWITIGHVCDNYNDNYERK